MFRYDITELTTDYDLERCQRRFWVTPDGRLSFGFVASFDLDKSHLESMVQYLISTKPRHSGGYGA